MNKQTEKISGNNSKTIVSNSQQERKSETVFGIESNRPEAIAQRKLQEAGNDSLQVKQLKAYQEMADSFSAHHPIQRYPQEIDDTKEFKDNDYPSLILIKLEKYEQYQIKGTDKVLFYEIGEGYYLDQNLTTKADMAEYAGANRAGISNLGGNSYDFHENKVTSGYLTIDAALDMLERFAQASDSNRNIDLGKVEKIMEEIKQRRPIYPIEVKRGETGYNLEQGRHRIYASMKAGFSFIPYNVI